MREWLLSKAGFWIATDWRGRGRAVITHRFMFCSILAADAALADRIYSARDG